MYKYRILPAKGPDGISGDNCFRDVEVVDNDGAIHMIGLTSQAGAERCIENLKAGKFTLHDYPYRWKVAGKKKLNLTTLKR